MNTIPNLDPYLADYLASLAPAPEYWDLDEPATPPKRRASVPYLRLVSPLPEQVRGEWIQLDLRL